MKPIEDKNRVDKTLIEQYEKIDGYDVMEELFLYKGEERVCRDMRVQFSDLLESAYFLYGLKPNPTNKLYVSYHLNRFYKHEGLLMSNGSIKVPSELYDKVKAINDKYKIRNNHERNNL